MDVSKLYYVTEDTIQKLGTFVLFNEESEKDSFFEFSLNEILTLLIAIIGAVIAVCQFRKQMEKNRELQTEQNKNNWYLSVIVIPQIQLINDFYRTLIHDLLNDISRPIPSIVDLGTVQSIRKEQINAFFEHVLSLVSSFDQELSNELSSKVQDLEDDVTIFLNRFFVNDDITIYFQSDIRRKLLENKKEIISLLYLKTNSERS